MKIHKLFGKRGFAVFTALALCVSLVSPSFAATFLDLQYAVQGAPDGRKQFTTTEGETRYGYGKPLNEDNTKYEIETWKEGDVRNVILNADVTADKPEGGVYRAVVLHDKNGKVELDLNGRTVTGKMAGEAALVVRGGDLTLKDSSEAKTGTVTGGRHAGVWVEAEEGQGGSFTLAGGTIMANQSYESDSTSNGVGVTGAGSTFTMTGGAIKDNNGNGAAVQVNNDATFTMTGGTIIGNASGNNKTVQGDSGNVTITGGTFSQLDDKYLPDGHSLDKNGVLTHTWGAGKVTEAATCTAAGVMTYTCTADGCGVTKTDSIAVDPDNHAWNGGKETKAATCTAEGETTYTCTAAGCGVTKTDSIAVDPDNHIGETELRGAKKATCEEDGYTGDTYCLGCNVRLQEGETTEKLAHKWDNGVVTTPATYEAEGEMTYTCHDCGATRAEPVDKLVPDEPVVEPDEPVVEPDEPVVEPDEPVVEPDEPVVEPDEPVVEPDEPVVEPDEPVVEPDEPVVEPDEPVVEPDEPVAEPDEPVAEPDEPVVEPDEPVVEPDEPVVEPDEPVVEPGMPVVDTPVEPEVEIDDPDVPLASGPMTGGEFIDYLWRHAGEPGADVVGSGEYAPAISWARSIGIIPDDGFDPDELVTVGAVRSILSSLAAYNDMVMPELTTLTGDDDEAVLNCDEVLAEFFGEELTE